MGNDLTTYQQAQLQVVGYRTIQSRVNEVIAEYGINTSQWIMLGWLHEHKDELRITYFAEILNVETPLVTALLQDLLTSKYVQVKQDSQDRRAKIVSLTKSGSDLVPNVEQALHSALEPLIRGIKKADLSTYFSVLRAIMQNAQ